MITLNHRLAGLAAALTLCFSAQAEELAHVVMLDGAPAAHAIAAARADGRTLDDAELQAERAAVAAEQEAFLDRLDAAGISYSVANVAIPDFTGQVTTVDLRYTLVNNAIALHVDDAAAATIAGMAGVKAVERDRVHPVQLDRSVDYVRAPALYGAVKELTQFDDFREGLEGQGVVVSVIDTGIDWSHEQFGGDPTPPRYGTNPSSAAVASNPKVIYYLGLFDNVLDDYGHGTHVAGTAAGYLGYAPGPDGVPLTGDDVPVHGVAPQAKLMGYKVCSGLGSSAAALAGTGVGCLGTAIALALEDSVSPRTLTGFAKPVAHVINLSLGGSGDADDFSSTNANNASLAGAIVVAAAGNDGPDLHTLGSPSLGNHVISVAAHNDPGVFPNSVEAAGLKLVAFKADDSNGTMPISAPITAPYVYAGLADTPDQVPASVLGNICLVMRGSTADTDAAGTGLFANKAAQCQAKGAIAMVLFNNEPGQMGGVLAPSAIPVVTMSQADGQALLDLGFDATGVSLNDATINPKDPTLFAPTITGFSSRGPSPKLYQVKPDLAAPGEAVLAATTATGVPVASMQSHTRYTNASGTSMATPHVAGAAALLKQANPGWGTEEVRLALMNTATDGRDESGAEAANDSILAQGAGLIDVEAAANISAFIGVAGDGISQPRLLGSHNFGAVPVVDSRSAHTESITVTLRDVAGNGGSWSLFTADNRDTAINGVTTTVADSTLAVPAGGSASTRLDVTVDGDVLRSLQATDGHRLRLQGYLFASNAATGEVLRMPFYYQPEMSLPANAGGSQTWTESGTLPASDAGLQLVGPVTFIDHEVEMGPGSFSLEATLSFADLAGGLPDLDLFLLDPNGDEVAASTTAGGPEQVSYTLGAPGTYVLRVNGWASAATDYELEITRNVASPAPAMTAPVENHVDANGNAISFDRTVDLAWTPTGGELAYEVLQSTDGETWTLAARIDNPGKTDVRLRKLASGTYQFAVQGVHPGVIGHYVTAASEPVTVVVDPRRRSNITRKIEAAISNVSFDGSVFSLDLALTNTGRKDYVPHLDLHVHSLQSASGTVEVINADNGGDGRSKASAGQFSYNDQVGDEVFASGETSSARTLRFADPAAELFSFKVTVYGFTQRDPAASGTAAPAAAAGDEPADDDGGLPGVLAVTVNPLTGSVDIQVLDALL